MAGFSVNLYFVFSNYVVCCGTVKRFGHPPLLMHNTDLTEQFKKNSNEDVMTYFWNVLVLKLWTFIFVLWMIVMNLTLVSGGCNEVPPLLSAGLSDDILLPVFPTPGLPDFLMNISPTSPPNSHHRFVLHALLM